MPDDFIVKYASGSTLYLDAHLHFQVDKMFKAPD